ncbi:MAG: glycoside hydrolase, partial [Spartobacteria bacterium]|nr:glycoside hydrolase [Spartobacteria bacterium]
RSDDIVEVNPLVPEGALEYFCLDNVSYHGHNLTILWDKTGERYGRGRGLRVLADGKEIARSETLTKVTGHLPKR